MGLTRNVSLATGLRYKGEGPMLTFVLHRISGLGIALFVGSHMLAGSGLVGSFGQSINAVYENWFFQIFVLFCALFHAINGLRITIFDLFPNLIEYQREAIWVEWSVFIPLFAIVLIVVVNSGLAG